MADVETARDLADKMSRNEYVSRWDFYYNRKLIRGLLDEYPEIVEELLEEYIESVLETI